MKLALSRSTIFAKAHVQDMYEEGLTKVRFERSCPITKKTTVQILLCDVFFQASFIKSGAIFLFKNYIKPGMCKKINIFSNSLFVADFAMQANVTRKTKSFYVPPIMTNLSENVVNESLTRTFPGIKREVSHKYKHMHLIYSHSLLCLYFSWNNIIISSPLISFSPNRY